MIRLKEVSKALGDQQILDGLDLEVPKGSSFAIMGPSGVGKSVLLKHIIGLLRPDAGTVLVDGKSVPDLNANELQELRRDMGYLFQHGALINWLNVFDNLALPLREHGGLEENKIMERVQEALSLVRLESAENKLPAELSGGMQKRVGLARALVVRPRIILYDEPEAGLDPGMSISIAEMIRRLQEEQGMTSVLVTHSSECASIAADRLGIFEGGSFLVEGPPSEVLQSNHPQVRAFLGTPTP